jgi:pyrroloquinoline quinone biosynthesis protein B
VAIPGKPPLYVTDADRADPGWNLGLRIGHRGKRLGYFPGVASIDAGLRAALGGLDALFFDGTLWSDSELIDLGLAQVRGRDMAHLPVSETLQALHGIDVARRWFIHINNTNPMLREDSPEAERVHAAGWALAQDGQEFEW